MLEYIEEQPEIIDISSDLRLRAYDGNYLVGLSWYRDPVVYYNSEGITNASEIPDENYVKSMYSLFNEREECELYFIEVRENGNFVPIGDVAFQAEGVPIVIGNGAYRGIGIGKKVLNALIGRARRLGWERISNVVIFDYNIASQRLFESVGFECVDQRGNEMIYELILCQDKGEIDENSRIVL